MLSKLLKYEIKATARLFLPIYAALLLFAFINGFLFSTGAAKPSGTFNVQALVSALSMFIYVILVIGIMVMTLVVMIQRFYKSLLGDEGYLMFTLPVKTWKHILNKLLVSMFWFILSGLIAVSSILVVANFDLPLNEISEALRQIKQYIGTAGIIGSVIYILLSTAGSILTIYVSIALGQLFNKHKLLASFGMFIVVSSALQILLSICMLAFRFDTLAVNFVNPAPAQIQLLIFYFIVCTAVISAVCFLVTDFILKKRLNLE